MTTEVTAALLARLWELAAAEGLHDSALARELGISPGYLSRLRRGIRGRHLSLRTAMRMVERFPELGIFLSATSPTITTSATAGETPDTEKPADQQG